MSVVAPPTGRIRSRTASNEIRASPTQNSGSDATISDVVLTRRSPRVPAREACHAPSATPAVKLITRAVPMSSNVLGRASASTDAADPARVIDGPRFPRANWPRKRTYCSQSGLSSPYATRQASLAVGLTAALSSVEENGSPGARWTRKNATEAAMRITTAP